jgi:hypothetical protein
MKLMDKERKKEIGIKKEERKIGRAVEEGTANI